MSKIRICNRCGHEVEVENHKDIDYPYYCPNCDENMYEIETSIINK